VLGGYDEKMPVMGMEDWDFWVKYGIAWICISLRPQNSFSIQSFKSVNA